MAIPQSTRPRIPLKEFEKLIDPNFVSANKIGCIKMLRDISGEGLRETKDFFDFVWSPFVIGKFKQQQEEKEDLSGDMYQEPSQTPPMFLIGHTYKQSNGDTVLIIGASNQGKSSETVYSMDDNGLLIHRYNRRDFGRVTGTSVISPDPRNLRVPE